MKEEKRISAVIVAKNEEKKVPDCLESLDWVSEIILVDNGSSDNTLEVARKFGAKVFEYKGGDFSSRKNFAFSKTKGDWILFIDADERVTTDLKKEICQLISNSVSKQNTYAISRRNIIFNKEFRYGNQWPDYIIRLFYRKNFKKWESELHEQPKYKGELKYLRNPLIHEKHNNISEMIGKTNKWSEVEAKLMYKAGHPKMNLIRFSTAIFREFFLRFVKQLSFLDGVEGVIYGIYQIYSRFISYAKLWEMQTNEVN